MADIVQLKENGVFKYLKTHAKAVEGLDAELAKKQDVSTLSRNTILWSGGLMMTGEHTITPSVALDKCENGWMIRFARYNPATAVRDDAYSVYVFIPKASVSIATDLPHGGESSAFSRKLLDVTNTTIQGKDGNQNSSPTSAVYRMIAVEVKSI